MKSSHTALAVFTVAVLFAWRHAIVAAEVTEIAQITGYGRMNGADQIATDKKLETAMLGVNGFIDTIGPLLVQHGLDSAEVARIKEAGMTVIKNRRIALEVVPTDKTIMAIDREAAQATRDAANSVMADYGISLVADDIMTRGAGLPSSRSDCKCSCQSDTHSSSSPSSSPV